MKKRVLFCLVLSTLAGLAVAGRPMADNTGPHECEIVITGDFDSRCLYEDKDGLADENPHVMIACKRSTVTYTAHADVGTATVGSYLWEVYGDVQHTVSGNQMTVEWSDASWGMVVVTVISSAGDTCTESRRVKLVAPPTAASVTVPAYTVLADGSKVVYVCSGASVEFIDQSTGGESDMAACHWRSTSSPLASTPTFVLENILMSDVVKHRVYNNCGCYDEEEIAIVLLEGTLLELDCYGTVCKNDIVEYRATAPSCTDYYWYVEGGSILGGQGTALPVVQWDHPRDGYGVIGLDGVLCDGLACPVMMSKKVPVIHEGLTIEGPTQVCLGESVLYNLPKLGSTEYIWSVTPSVGVNTELINRSNEIRLVFEQAGTYVLRCSYRCDFLDCGPYEADSLTITVKPNLRIEGDDQICYLNPCHLTTDMGVSVEWKAYDLSNGNQQVATATGVSFVHTFNHKGRYLVTAEHSGYCGPATFLLTVKDAPPAPTLGDLAPGNPHVACPNHGIVLHGIPSEPNYSLVWAPACTTATPQLYSGDSVVIRYNGEVCDVRVYNYDRELQCQSTGYYEHQVDVLTPAPLGISPSLTVCPGSLIVWGNDVVPDQSGDGMLYEWKIQSDRQNCASVQGNHMAPAITLAVNNIATPATFYVKLTRQYCGGYTDDYIQIHVVDSSANQLSISGPDSVCIHGQGTYTGSGLSSGNDYRWNIGGNTYTDNPATVTFDHAGTMPLYLRGNPYDYCTNESQMPVAVKNVVVLPPVPVLGLRKSTLGYNTTVSVYPTPGAGCTYQWQYQASGSTTPVTLTGANSVPYVGPGLYTCTVTRDGCSVTVTWDSELEVSFDPGCDTLTVNSTYNPCDGTIEFSTPGNLYVMWYINQGSNHLEPELSGVNGHTATVDIDGLGIYSASVTQYDFSHNCTRVGKKKVYVNVIPDFTFEKACDKIVLHNHSLYANGNTMLYIRVTNSDNNTVETFMLPASTQTYNYTPSSPIPNSPRTYTFTLTGIGSNGNVTPCTLGVVTIRQLVQLGGTNPVSITTANAANGNITCDNTPIELTATLSPSGTVVSSNWTFGDNSGFETSGNAIYHTFAYDFLMYPVSVIVTDDYGCQFSSATPLNVSSFVDNLHDVGSIDYDLPYICPNTNASKDIVYTPLSASNSYSWTAPYATSASTPTSSNIYPTYYQGNYKLYVENIRYCKLELSEYVRFLSSPFAGIYAKRYSCCVGDEVKLYGQQGPGSEPLDYSWIVTGPGGYSESYTTPNIRFVAPDVPGAYTVMLTVTNTSTTCSSTATETLTVLTPPAAPTIAVVGSPCIGDAPVHLTASGYSGEMHWSNGETGPDAYYFSHGLLSAYYFDPALGCPSSSAQYRIDRQPDFDALLTGCYKKCNGFFNYDLLLLGLVDAGQNYAWNWKLDGNTIAWGTTGGFQQQLPLVGFGNYQLTVTYGGGACTDVSPTLTLDGSKTNCNCDSIDISYNVELEVVKCRLHYDVEVVVCNRYKNKYFCPDKPVLVSRPNGDFSFYTDALSPSIAPDGCDTFHIYIEMKTLEPLAACFKIEDSQCARCEKVFCIDLLPEGIDCHHGLVMDILQTNTTLSNAVAGYFDFCADVTPAEEVLAFWTEPPMVVNSLFDGIHSVCGLGMIDMAVLSQLINQDGDVCFHALICSHDELCILKYCTPASKFFSLFEDYTRSLPDIWDEMHNGGQPAASSASLCLQPNPASGEVSVVGTADEVVEVMVMDMHGRQMAVYDHTAQFSVAALAAGSYIVRVRTQDVATAVQRIHYLKLVKQ